MELWAQILTSVLAILSIAFGVWIYKLKGALAQAKVIIEVILEAMKDSTITKEELALIAIEIQKLIDLFKTESVNLVKSITSKFKK
jgi:hypothetical protein